MCIGASSPAIPAPPPDPKLTEPRAVSEAAKGAKKDQLKQAKLSAGRQSTVLTGSMGVEDNAKVATKTVLGQ